MLGTNTKMLAANTKMLAANTNTNQRKELQIGEQLGCSSRRGGKRSGQASEEELENMNELNAKDEESSEDSSEDSSSEEESSSSDDDEEEEHASWSQSHQYNPGGG